MKKKVYCGSHMRVIAKLLKVIGKLMPGQVVLHLLAKQQSQSRNHRRTQ